MRCKYLDMELNTFIVYLKEYVKLPTDMSVLRTSVTMLYTVLVYLHAYQTSASHPLAYSVKYQKCP